MKIKLAKGELKKQRDALKQYERYLPTLQLKKQQLQIEIIKQSHIFEEKRAAEEAGRNSAAVWAGLLSDERIDVRPWTRPKNVITGQRGIAGVDIPIFESIEFKAAEYDLFETPLWVDTAVDALRAIATLRSEIDIIKKGADILRNELRITAQRVNLFEKVKIPEAKEAVRVIKIYLSDQMANAVGRSKIAKRKIEKAYELAV